MKKRYYYLITIQYLGFRYHGWQKQTKLKTVHLMIDKTLSYIFESDSTFKTLGASRTDAMVSANASAFELFIDYPILDFEAFLNKFNYYLPQDIKALSVVEISKEFNIIQSSKIKEYHYLFAHGEKTHPFCASIMTTFRDELDIERMKLGAKLFEGEHYFKSYCSNVKDEGLYHRTILSSEIVENTIYDASFFPSKSYLYKIKAKGFGQNQVRLMMGVLAKLGKGEITLDFIKDSLKNESQVVLDDIAPASGLILDSITFDL
ncbi:tRNA pseudouridine38-40 synthase [Flavobacteriaceae bacterium MAR_2010_105]|nr:tRNA pseudouridine38-40 synthase [Flavobacteriaceae bacterium MAR_2010_105]